MKKASILVRMPPQLKRRFQEAVKDQGQPSMTWVITFLLEEYVKKHESKSLEAL